MNFAGVEKIANAVLYEGYILYPYRASSTKNRQRWNFGTLYPRSYAESQRPSEACRLITECLVAESLVESVAEPKLEVRIRFLQLVESDTNRTDANTNFGDNGNCSTPQHSVDTAQDWQQGIDRTWDFSGISLNDLMANPRTLDFAFAEADTVKNARAVTGQLSLSAHRLPEGLIKLHLELVNLAQTKNPPASRNQALLYSFTSAHLLLGISGGEFISILDPPQPFSAAASQCENVGVFPVLAGTEGDRSMMLCSPIILYDHPQVAPESAGDFFDATEMDEMLALRVLTLTDNEKREMLQDDRSRKILERTESLPPEHLMKVHGAIRGLRRVQQEHEEENS